MPREDDHEDDHEDWNWDSNEDEDEDNEDEDEDNEDEDNEDEDNEDEDNEDEEYEENIENSIMAEIIIVKGYLLKVFLNFDGVKDLLLTLIPNWDDIKGFYSWDNEHLSCCNMNKNNKYYCAMKYEMKIETLEVFI